MKKTLLAFFAAMMLTIAPANAQLQWGILVGTNLSKVHFSKEMKKNLNNLKSSNTSGFYFGPKVNFTLPIVGLGADAALLYSQKRLEIEGNNGTNTVSSSSTFRSLEIPINVRYTYGFSSLAAVYLATGPQFGFNLGNRTWDFKSVDSSLEALKFKKKNMNTSWNIGAGVKLINHLEVGLLYNFSISKYYKKAAGEGYDFNGNSFQVQAAYLF